MKLMILSTPFMTFILTGRDQEDFISFFILGSDPKGIIMRLVQDRFQEKEIHLLPFSYPLLSSLPAWQELTFSWEQMLGSCQEEGRRKTRGFNRKKVRKWYLLFPTSLY